jgi:hypothetical protein
MPPSGGTMMPPSTQTAPTGSMGNGPGGSEMNALTNNPNGAGWLQKFNRPNVTSSVPHHKSKHRTKRASGGGGH